MTKPVAKLKSNQASEKYVGVFPLEFNDGGTDGGVAIPDTIHLIPIGQWEHDLYGPISITAQDIREFVQNFNAGIRKGVPITAGHEGYEELPAVAWISEVEARDNGLWGKVEWNGSGKELLNDKAFKFFSPEFYRDYEDAETHQIYRNVLVGGALTKSPYFKELQAIVFSEKIIKQKFNTMNLQELLAKKLEDLSDEEKAFIKEHASELTEEQKTAFTSVVDEPETPEQKEAREKQEAEAKAAADQKAVEDAHVAAGLNPDGSAKVEASEKKVMISAAELAMLQDKANKGVQAFKELETAKLNTAVTALMFSESNKAGKFLPKSKDNLRAFMETLNDAQRAKFTSLLAEMPKSDIFSEKGTTNAATEGSTTAEIEAKVKVKMSENKDLKYSDALRAVMNENQGLAERYSEELPSAKKVQA